MWFECNWIIDCVKNNFNGNWDSVKMLFIYFLLWIGLLTTLAGCVLHTESVISDVEVDKDVYFIGLNICEVQYIWWWKADWNILGNDKGSHSPAAVNHNYNFHNPLNIM